MGDSTKRPRLLDSIRIDIYERDGGRCRYCGDGAECVDHIVPYSVIFNHDRHNLVACCKRCNSIAGARVFPSFEEKKRFVRLKREGHPLQEKRVKLPPTAVWTIEEITEMSAGWLRGYIYSTAIIVENKEDPRYILANMRLLSILRRQ